MLLGCISAMAAQPLPKPATATNEMEITCDGGFHYSTNQGPKAVFRDNVHITDPQMELMCELLTVYFQTNYNIDMIIAETNVVVIQQDNWAIGDRAVYTATNGIMELTGNVMLDTPRGYSFASVVVYDRNKDSIYAPGRVKMVLPTSVGTNFTGFGLPGAKSLGPPKTNAPPSK